MNCSNTASERTVELSRYQQMLMRPALACIQFGAGFYFADLIKPYILPVLMVSVLIVAIIGLQSWKKT
jgi:hypothetical protein